LQLFNERGSFLFERGRVEAAARSGLGELIPMFEGDSLGLAQLWNTFGKFQKEREVLARELKYSGFSASWARR